MWPALVKLAPVLEPGALDKTLQEHTARGAHRTVIVPFPEWVPAEIAAAAKKLSATKARAVLAPFVV